MSQALLIIDYSNDFIDEKGALSCGEPGRQLDGVICRLMEETAAAGGFVVVCNDRHEETDLYHPERALFPAHNLAGTWGEEIYGETGKRFRHLQASQAGQTLYLPKIWYSAFHDTPLDAMLRQRGVNEITVCGVCTDICVLHTVTDAYYRGYTVKVKADACAALSPEGQRWGLAHMRDSLGAELI
ncbi:MAG: cysteine hydrolase [Firmicutes bacterium]|nr:cysteine hydrolase [Bacillota bacterium]